MEDPNYMIAVIGLCGAVAGAFIGATTSLIATWLQLSHAQKENRTQREMEMRKQIYFDAYEAAVLMQTMLVELMRSEAKDMVIDAEASAALGKLHTIAGIELIEAVTGLQQYISGSALQLVPTKLLCESLQGKINHAHNMHELFLKQHNDWSERLKEENLSSADLTFIQEQQKVLSDKMNTCMSYVNTTSVELLKMQTHLLEVILRRVLGSAQKLSECNVLIRKELDIAFSGKDLQNTTILSAIHS